MVHIEVINSRLVFVLFKRMADSCKPIIKIIKKRKEIEIVLTAYFIFYLFP